MSALRSDGNRRGTALALAALGLWVGGTACTAIIGVSDLPPATGTEAEAGRPEAGHDGATTHDATSDGTTDATRDARQPDAQVDATRADASEAGHVDTGTVDAGHDAAPPPAFVVSPLSLPFGDAGGKPGYIACGSGAAPTRELTLTNNSSATLSWWTSLSQGAASPYTLSTSCTPSATCTLGTATRA